MKTSEIFHPDFRLNQSDWVKWRLTYEGGRPFINAYLKRYSRRETVAEFNERKEITYCPAFAAAAVDDVKNSIYQRMVDIKRVGGDPKYQEAIKGLNGGVDLSGSSMAMFMGQKVLPELLTMKKVGIYMDMPQIMGETIAEVYKERPYVYYYSAESICSWDTQYIDGQQMITAVLLKDYILERDTDTGLVSGSKLVYRRVWLAKDGVHIKMTDQEDNVEKEFHFPTMKRVPFIILELSDSLLKNIADYQIALMNVASSDLMYLIKSNFPFYVEPYDPRSENTYNNRPTNGETDTTDADAEADADKRNDITVGVTSGRKYPVGANPPEFIHPSPEPIKAAIEKEEQMKNEIRHLLNLTLSNLSPKFASAESKGMDQRSLESGLSNIGLTMEYGEREMAKIWAMYLGLSEHAQVNYPERYALKSEQDRREDAKQLAELLPSAPSRRYKKEMAKKIARTMLEQDLEPKVLNDIYTEIDDAPYIDGTAADVVEAVSAGLVTEETASFALGYDGDKEVPKARQQHSDRLARIAAQQTTGVQGVPDTQGKPGINDNKNPGAGRPPVKKKGE
jgi:hypothetical protein